MLARPFVPAHSAFVPKAIRDLETVQLVPLAAGFGPRIASRYRFTFGKGRTRAKMRRVEGCSKTRTEVDDTMSRRPMFTLFAASALAALSATATPQSPLGRAAAAEFQYDATAPMGVKEIDVERRDGVVVRDLTYVGAAGKRIAVYLIEPASALRRAGALYVHWVENDDPTSNRTEFLTEAVELAKRGTVSLLIDAMWSDPAWFMARKHADDYAISVGQVKELRRAADLLFHQPNVVPERAAYVGHDFGAMYGTVMAGVDNRFSAWVLMTPTASFSDWFLYAPKIEGEERRKFIAEMAPLDPVRFVGFISPRPVLLQFGTADPHVPRPKAEAYVSAARDPKEVRWYEAGHGLNDQATRDRIAWLVAKLQL